MYKTQEKASDIRKIAFRLMHDVGGGHYGGNLSEIVCDECPVPVKRLGVNDVFCVGASIAYLSHQHGFDAEGIIHTVRESLQR